MNKLVTSSLITAFSLSILFIPKDVNACSCMLTTPIERLAQSDAVFVGKAISVKVTPNPYNQSVTLGSSANTILEISKFWKPKTLLKYVELKTNADAMCGFGIPQLDKTYLVYANKLENGSYITGACSGTAFIEDSGTAIEQLGNSQIPVDTENPFKLEIPPVKVPQPLWGHFLFYRDLQIGSAGSDVKVLQEILNLNKFTVSVSGTGSPGNESTYFGPLTKTALIKFQETHKVKLGITTGTGFFGPLTRNFLNSLLKGPERGVE